MSAFLIDCLNWLLQPFSGNVVHEISSAVSWHGRLMVLTWGVILPLGVVVARFFKITPKQNWPHELDNKLWWKLHLYGQSTGVVLACIALWLVWGGADDKFQFAQLHRLLGWCVMGFAAAQILGGVLRGSKGGPTSSQMRGDHYDMTRWRRGFERVHKALGYVALLLACATLFVGLWVADAPRWMWLILVLWYLFLLVLSVRWQRQGRCVDTYQAIWGDDAQHPGNALKPIGWGIKKYPQVPK
jgi:hypothetical protein